MKLTDNRPPVLLRSLDDFGPYDILCGRTKESFNNIGNRRFRVTVGLYLNQYLEAGSRIAKSQLIISIVHYLRVYVGVRFLKEKFEGASHEGYVELGERGAREKVGHALRDLTVTIHRTTIAEFKEAGGMKKRRPLESKKRRPPESITRKKPKKKHKRVSTQPKRGEVQESTESSKMYVSLQPTGGLVQESTESKNKLKKEKPKKESIKLNRGEERPPVSNQFDDYEDEHKDEASSKQDPDDEEDPELYEETLNLFLATYGKGVGTRSK
jgi:hypothetical protein